MEGYVLSIKERMGKGEIWAEEGGLEEEGYGFTHSFTETQFSVCETVFHR